MNVSEFASESCIAGTNREEIPLPTMNPTERKPAMLDPSLDMSYREGSSASRDCRNHAWMRLCPCCLHKLSKSDPTEAWNCQCGWQSR